MKRSLIAIATMLGAVQAQAQDSIFTVGQQVEVKVGGGWRPCTVTDPGGSTRMAYAECPEFETPSFTYPAIVENFLAGGTMDVRLPGSCETTSRNAVTRKISGCRVQGVPAQGTEQPTANPPRE